MEIAFYVMYFPESPSSIPSEKKNVQSQQNDFKTVKWVYNLAHNNLSRGRIGHARSDQS